MCVCACPYSHLSKEPALPSSVCILVKRGVSSGTTRPTTRHIFWARALCALPHAPARPGPCMPEIVWGVFPWNLTSLAHTPNAEKKVITLSHRPGEEGIRFTTTIGWLFSSLFCVKWGMRPLSGPRRSYPCGTACGHQAHTCAPNLSPLLSPFLYVRFS